MKSPQVIRARLAARLEANCTDQQVKNNKVHYSLRFENSVGWDWAERQVQKTANDEGVELELWKIRPSGVNDFEIEVRELVRREDGNDDQQHGLYEYE
jgi:hypothetical protein